MHLGTHVHCFCVHINGTAPHVKCCMCDERRAVAWIQPVLPYTYPVYPYITWGDTGTVTVSSTTSGFHQTT